VDVTLSHVVDDIIHALVTVSLSSPPPLPSSFLSDYTPHRCVLNVVSYA
jgi:hypothetical protein